MFKEIILTNTNPYTYSDTFMITDEDFISEITITTSSHIWSMCLRGLIAVILEYQKRQLPIVPNIALYYMLLTKLGYRVKYLMEESIEDMNMELPELKYSVRYYPQIKDYYNKLLMLS